ncbi:hypothetical protein SAMN05444362_12174 [Dysgonomonas macrotermitis]|uniref:Uncharacterized protein n=1 Tax=Dysgonomonas macrotermitis TaxID=1346286 RepID=A0A1M5J073_9BACT|nr:hypothetical protein SAMN05444362_12174 [Dysgonomonas macrotermitis]
MFDKIKKIRDRKLRLKIVMLILNSKSTDIDVRLVSQEAEFILSYIKHGVKRPFS